MKASDLLIGGKTSLSVLGLGYVGMPLAVSFSKHVEVVGFDVNADKIQLYNDGIDPTNEVGNDLIKSCAVEFTSNPEKLKEARFHIVAVPTPINQDKTPNLSPVESVSKILGQYLMPGSIVVFESTVYPGVTEEVCIPILERESGLKCGLDFKVGYSPERINPGDKVHTLATITKIVSGMDEESLEEIKKVYDLIIEAGTHPVSSIKTAEAIKVVENSQRDVNIAFMNELAMVFDRMGIDTNEVVDGMNTKWNALGYRPGLVGGHCIGVDPYYFTYEAERLGYHSQIILAGRMINDGMGKFIAEAAIKQMILAGQSPRKSNVAILGLTFKENCPDIRNSKVIDVVNVLKSYGIEPQIVDPWAEPDEVLQVYSLTLSSIEDVEAPDCIILAVAHNQFVEDGSHLLASLLGATQNKVVVDVKGILPPDSFIDTGVRYWRL